MHTSWLVHSLGFRIKNNHYILFAKYGTVFETQLFYTKDIYLNDRNIFLGKDIDLLIKKKSEYKKPKYCCF